MNSLLVKRINDHNALISVELMALSMYSKPKGVLVLKKFQILCQKSPGESRYPELNCKIYCLYPQGYTVQRHLCFIEDVSLPLEARKWFLA
jgi:hypothetical protein